MSKLSQYIIVALILLGLFGLASSKVHNWDIFWQLQSGRHMVETRELLTTDVFSLAPDAPRVEHCWLHDILVYAVYLAGGYVGLSLWKGLLVAATALLLGLTAYRRGASLLSVLAVGLPAFLLPHGGWQDRPQLWSYLFFAIFLWTFEAHRQGSRRALWLLPPIMLLWANMHAAAVLAVLLLLPGVAGEAAERWWLRRPALSTHDYRRLLYVSGAVVLAGLVTPYGPHLAEVLLGAPTLGEASGMVTQLYNSDWRPTTWNRNPQYFYAMAATVLLLAAGWRRLRLPDLLMLGGLAVMGLSLERHTPFLLMAMAALLPLYLDAAIDALRRHSPAWLPQAARYVVVSGLFVLAAILARDIYRQKGFFNVGLGSMDVPAAAADFVRTERLPGNLFNSYDWGGYLMWALYPDYQVFWDGRQNSVAMFKHGMAVMWLPVWQQTLDRFDVNIIVLKALSGDVGGTYPLHDNLRRSPDWALVYADEVAVVFIRRGSMPPIWMSRNELPKEQMDDTLLAQAVYFNRYYPWRYKAWWERARILMRRGDRGGAYEALHFYMKYAPPESRDPQAVQAYQLLSPAGS